MKWVVPYHLFKGDVYRRLMLNHPIDRGLQYFGSSVLTPSDLVTTAETKLSYPTWVACRGMSRDTYLFCLSWCPQRLLAEERIGEREKFLFVHVGGVCFSLEKHLSLEVLPSAFLSGGYYPSKTEYCIKERCQARNLTLDGSIAPAPVRVDWSVENPPCSVLVLTGRFERATEIGRGTYSAMCQRMMAKQPGI